MSAQNINNCPYVALPSKFDPYILNTAEGEKKNYIIA